MFEKTVQTGLMITAMLMGAGTASAMGDKDLSKVIAKQANITTEQASATVEAFKAAKVQSTSHPLTR